MRITKKTRFPSFLLFHLPMRVFCSGTASGIAFWLEVSVLFMHGSFRDGDEGQRPFLQGRGVPVFAI